MKSLKWRMVGINCMIILFCLLFVVIICFSLFFKELNTASYDKYNMQAQKCSEEITSWLIGQTEMVANQTNSIKVIGEYNQKELSEYLAPFVDTYNKNGYIYDIYFTSTDNVMACGSGFVPDGSIDYREREWYQEALKTEGQYISSSYLDSDTGKYIITISQKVETNEGLKGVLAADIFVDTMVDIINKQSLPKDSYIFLLDDKEGIVTHPYEAYGYVEDKPMQLSELPNTPYNVLLSQESSLPIVLKDYDTMQRSFFVNTIDLCGWKVIVGISTNVIRGGQYQLLVVSISSLILSLLIGMGMSILTANKIVKPIKTLTYKIEKGDLTTDVVVQSKDEVGHLAMGFNRMLDNLRVLLHISNSAAKDISIYSDKLNSLAGEIINGAVAVDGGMMHINEIMNRQSQDMEKNQTEMSLFNSAINEVNTSFTQMQDSISQSVNQVKSSYLLAEKVETTLTKTAESMTGIYEETKDLENISDSIDKITVTINSISHQTNLLALNASIEAARAGEAGKSFAIVADEIRTLSEQTADATKEISGLVSHINNIIKNTVETINISNTLYNESQENSKQMITAFRGIHDQIGEIGKNNLSIADKLNNFVKSNEKIGEMFRIIHGNINKCTQYTQSATKVAKEQNSSVDELAQSAKELVKMSDSLKESTSKFSC